MADQLVTLFTKTVQAANKGPTYDLNEHVRFNTDVAIETFITEFSITVTNLLQSLDTYTLTPSQIKLILQTLQKPIQENSSSSNTPQTDN